MKQLTKEWLKAAGDDLIAIESLIDNPILTSIVAFHSQQAIEKSMKAVIEEFDIAFIKTHSIQTLFLRIENIISFSVNELIISELDRLYLDSRYPGDFGLMPFGKPTLEEAEMYFQEALKLKNQVEAFLMEHRK
ncbi:MAG: HEPN domain-containing protein [Bacteroidia bacterium]|nr:HEPN domain-containing protein [Bacteroidia bacterium]